MAKSDSTVFGLIARAHAGTHRFATHHLYTTGVAPFEQWLLEEIPDDGRASASELAHRLEVPPSTVTRALRRLEAVGYLELRKGYMLDARVLLSRLTEPGRRVRDDGRGFEREIDEILLRNVPPPVLGGLVKGLFDILRALQREEAQDRETGRGTISSG